MSILINKDTKVLVQGITGRSGTLQTKIMKEYGTKVVAGVTPGKGGKEIEGVPVYNYISEAIAKHQIDAAINFVPAPYLKDSGQEAIDNDIKFMVLTAEEIPDHDIVELINYSRAKNATILGPGTPGIFAPGKCKLGAHPTRMFKEGRVGVVSKSGALSYEVCKQLTEAGIGQSTVVGLGGGPIWGISQTEVLSLFQKDQETDIIVLLGEIGGTMEEQAAKYIAKNISKPVVAMIVGRAAPEGKSLGHAGAIIEGDRGTAQAKIKALSDAGAHVARTPGEIVNCIKELSLNGVN